MSSEHYIFDHRTSQPLTDALLDNDGNFVFEVQDEIRCLFVLVMTLV